MISIRCKFLDIIFTWWILSLFLWKPHVGADLLYEPAWGNRNIKDSVVHMSISPTGLPEQVYPFQNVSLPWSERVDDLVSRLTLDEIQIQMARGGAHEYGTPAPAIPRLGIGPYVWNSNCHRGDQQVLENATAFPQSIGLAASFSTQLLFDVATASSVETRGKHNDFVRRGVFATHTGASCFSPVINIVRDTRWGRIQETYGEDPFMSGELAAAFISGLHGNDSRYVRVTGGCLHLDAYSGPENIPTSRFSFDAQATDEDLHMTYLPGFRRCVQAGTYSIMCSHNSVNGIPACANKKLMTDILRNDWNFTGYVVSDQGAIENFITRHHYVSNYISAAVAAVEAGVNLESSNNLPQPVFLSIADAVKQGKLPEDLVRERVKPLFYTRMRLGQFDPPDHNPYAKLNNSVVETPEHQALAVEAAMKSFVLLKNENNILPLKTDTYKQIAIIGPMADNIGQMFGNLPPLQDRSFSKTPLEGLREVFPSATYEKVCQDGTRCKNYKANLVPKIVANKDLVIAILGTGPIVESEGHDRHDLELPGHQKQLLMDIMKYSEKAPVVLLLMNAGPLNVTFADNSDRVPAIVECFFPGQATGVAIKNILTNSGPYSSPAGRLPNTWPMYGWQLPPMINYSMQGRTYRYLKTEPLYPFGYGLSYSTFSYKSLSFEKEIKAKQDLNVNLTLTNTGHIDSDEVIQCYISWAEKYLPVPIRQLAYFGRVHLKAGQEITAAIIIPWQTMAFWKNGVWYVSAGSINLYCGGQQPFQKKQAPSNVLSGQFTITTTAKMSTLTL